eukprot:GEMP01000116.1.p1 GENE.GEMP01000116.1~~GEMP01000116.1.p1  ORF type:complete len:2959 (-),score=502.06 GEMP01000116.1:1049-9925(-)
MLIMLSLFFALHAGALGAVCPSINSDSENLDGDREYKILISADDTPELYDATEVSSNNIEDFAGRLAISGEVISNGIEAEFVKASAVRRASHPRFVFQLSVPSSLWEEPADDEFRRQSTLTFDDFLERATSLHNMMREGRAGSSAQQPRGIMGRLETYEQPNPHAVVQHPAMRALLAHNGIITFFFVNSILSLINDKNADVEPFGNLLAYVGLIPMGMGALDEVTRTAQVASWLLGKMGAEIRIIRRIIQDEGLVFSVLRRIPSPDRFAFLRRTQFQKLFERGVESAGTRLLQIDETLTMWRATLKDALDACYCTFRRFQSWIRESARGVPYALNVVRTKLTALTTQIKESVQSFVKNQLSHEMRGYTKLNNLVLEASDLAAEFKVVSGLDLDIKAARWVLSERVGKLATTFKTISAAMEDTILTNLASEGLQTEVNGIVTAATELSDFATKSILSPAISQISISSPESFAARVSPSAQKSSQFALRAAGKLAQLESKLPEVARNALSYMRNLRLFSLNAFAGKVAGLMERATPFLVAFDVVYSVYNFMTALKQLDLAKLNPDMMELAVTNMIITSIYLVNAAVNLVLTGILYAAQMGIVAAGVAAVATMIMGVLAVFIVVFMLITYFIMKYVALRLTCRQKLKQFHHYTTSFARQLELFMNPSKSLTTFTTMDTVYDRFNDRNVTVPSYLSVKSLIVNAHSYFPELEDWTSYLSNNGNLFTEKYGTLQTENRIGSITAVILPINIYSRPGEHKCGSSHNGCTPSRSRQRRSLLASHVASSVFMQSQRAAIAGLYRDPSSSQDLFVPKDTPQETVETWMIDGHRMVKHDSECEETRWLTYSEATMPLATNDKRQMSLEVNVASLDIRSPAIRFPDDVRGKSEVEYSIMINGNPAHQPGVEPSSSANHSLHRYTLSIPWLHLRRTNDPDYTYIITHNTPHDAHWTIEFPHWKRASSLRWDGVGGVREDFAAFCVSDGPVDHTWTHVDDEWFYRTDFARRLRFQAPESSNSNSINDKIGFLIKRGHYQFTVDPKTKMYQMVAVTLKDPGQRKYEMEMPSETIVTDIGIQRDAEITAVLDVLQGYRRSNGTINGYTRGAVPFPIYFGAKEHRPTFYFNPYEGADRQWSFFCPRWKDGSEELTEVGFAFDCGDNLLPDHTVHNVGVTPRGLNVTFDFPELNRFGDAMNSTITVLFPLDGVATVQSVRCPDCDRIGVQTALKGVLLNLKDTKGLVTSVFFHPRGLHIEHAPQRMRFYHPEVNHRHAPFDATQYVMLGYFRTGDCFMLRDRMLTNGQESIQVYRAAGVPRGTANDDSMLAVLEPDMSDTVQNTAPGNRTRRTNSHGDNSFRAAMQTNDPSCPVQAVNRRNDVFCVTCLDITLMEARSFAPFRYPQFNERYVYSKRPAEFLTNTVSVQQADTPTRRVLPGVLFFNNRVFELPSETNHRFIGHWVDFDCAAFVHADNERVSCYGAFSEVEVQSCQAQEECVFTTAPDITHFTTSNGNAAHKRKEYLDQLHLTSDLEPRATFVCNVNPTKRFLTVEYVVSSRTTNYSGPAAAPPLLVLNNADSQRAYVFGGCHFDAPATMDASHRVESLVGVVSRERRTWQRSLDSHTDYDLARAIFVNMETGQLFRLLSDNGDWTNCQTRDVPYAFIGRPFGTLASTPAEIVASTSDKESTFMSVLELRLPSTDSHLAVTVPYIRGFVTQRVTVLGGSTNTNVQFMWDEFNAIPADKRVRISIFIPESITYVENLPSNFSGTVRIYLLNDSRGDEHTAVDDTTTPTFDAYENHDVENPCSKCRTEELCIASSVCFDPTQSFTHLYPRVLDPRFLSSEPSHRAKFYCTLHNGIKHCHDKRLLYTILGRVLANNFILPVDNNHIILHTTRTYGVICLCHTHECETTVMRRILSLDSQCNFVVRPLTIPSHEYFLPGVFRAYRLFPEPDALSARGRVGHARIELSHLSGSSDSIIQRNVDKYREFVSDNIERDMLGCSAQRIAFAESVERGVFVQVTSTCAVHAHEENQVPAPQYLESFPEKYVPPFLNALFDHLRTGNLDIRANDLVDIARSLLRFAVHAVRHNYDLTALSPWDFFCSIYLDAVGRYIYYDPLGGVSFFAYHKLEKTGAANVENILIWVRTLLHSVMGAVAVQDSIPITVYDAQDELRSALEKLVSTHVANVTVLEQNIASLEVVLSSFPRLLQCDVPVNARLAAEHTAVTRFLHTGEVVVTSITERNVEVFAFGESYARPDGRDGMFLDAICPIKVVTLQVCTRSSRDSQIGTITNVTLRYDVSHSHQRDAPNIITTLDTLESCSLCPKVLTCATGSRRVSSFHQCQCVQCRDEYVHISTSHEQCLFAHFDYAPRGAWLHTRSMAVVSNSIWFDVSGLTDGPLYSRATRMPCASSPPACSYWNCAYDATIFPRAPSCFVRQDENPPVTTTLSNEVALLNMPTALTLHANLTGCLETSELPFPGAKHQFVGHYRQMNDWRNGYPVWRKIEPPSGNAGILPHSTCANHYLVYKKVSSDESYWAFACTVDDIDNDNDQLKPYPSDHGAPNLLPVLGGYFSPGFVVSVRQVHKCCDLVVVRALSKNDQCVSAATYHTTNMYQTYILQKGASTKTYLSVDGNFTLEQFMFDGATHWKLMMASEELMKWRVYSHEEEDFTSCVERQSDGAAYTGLKVECLLVHLELTANGTPLASLTESNMDATWCSANTHSVDRCHEARPEYKVEDWGLTQPGSWCQWVCDNLWATRQCMAYKGAPPWCYLWMSRESSSGPVDFVQSSLVCPVLQAVSPNENVPQSCNPHDVFANGVLRRSIVQLGKLLHELRNTDATTGAAELSAFKRLVNGHDAAAEQYLEELAAVITQRGVLHNHVPNLRYISFIPVHSCLRHDSSKCLESRDSDTDCCAAPSDMGCASGYYLYLGEPGCGRDLPGVHSTCCEPPSLLFHSDVIAILAFIKQLQRDSTN